jgi:AraC family transcriptional regulator of adaptative response / DNA-3-methyladenine glycosylase II
MSLDLGVCSRARLARDARFDGKFFIGTLTTKIYCRPTCRSRTSQESNVRYFPSAAAAAEAGFRPCLRCHPECAPGTPARAGTQNTVSRALRLIGEMGLEDGGVEALAEHVGMGSRHLRRLFLRHLGATPSAVAHTRRLQFAKRLIDETALAMTQVAFASGFGSVRRFNAAIHNVYHRTPTQLRRLARQMVRRPEGHYLFHLSFRPHYDWQSILELLAAQATPGVEVIREGYYRRSILLQENRGYLEVSLGANGNALGVRIQFRDPRSLFPIIERVRGMFDLDADWSTIARTLATDPALAARVSGRPGLRVPGCWNGFEFATRAILGQEIDSDAAKALAGRMVIHFGLPYGPADGLTHLFPTPEVLALADLESIGLPQRQADAIRALSCLVRDGQIRFEKIADPEGLLARLRQIPGIERSAAQWIAMRALREPDAIPSADPEFARALGVASPIEVEQCSEAWRPWRAYAAMYLWTSRDRTSARERAATVRGTGKPDNRSMLIEHVPSDNRNTRAILKELVRNAHDAYLLLEPRRLEEEKLERAVVISRQRNGDNKGQLFIEDNGLGQSLKHLLRELQTSIRCDLERLKTRSGSAKLCSWPILSAGSKVMIESSTKGIAGELHVAINVRRIYDKMDAAISVDHIVSDSECISVSRVDFDKRQHGTTVVIECDGKTEIVNGYLLNCFYDLTDTEDETLSQFLAEGCPTPYSMEDRVRKKIRTVYGRASDIPTAIYLDGRSIAKGPSVLRGTKERVPIYLANHR